MIAMLNAGPALFGQWAQLGWDKVAGGLKQPTQITSARDGSGRLFIVELPGRVRILQDGVLAEKPFLDISDRVGYDKERGLFSVAFPPDFANKQRFYAFWMDPEGGIVIARYKVSDDPNAASVDSEEIVLQIPVVLGQHNGGMMAFSPADGMLYIGVGDGGIGVEEGGLYLNDPLGIGQNPGTLSGKILRIDPESGGAPYAIPEGNPRLEGWLPEIWSIGWRNPWRFSFDRLTGDFYGGDVGADAYEEVNFEPAGAGGRNYGWSEREGLHCLPDKPCGEREGLTDPVLEYDHTQGCSVTGGVVYRGGAYPELQGQYLYGDFCKGTIWGLRRVQESWQSAAIGASGALIVGFGEDEDGEVYVVDYKGSILRLKAVPSVLSIVRIVNTASGEAGISPGSLASVFTTGLPGVDEEIGAWEEPLPFSLADVSVWVNGTRAAIASVAPGGRVDFLVPHVVPGERAAVQVRDGLETTEAREAEVRAVQPGIFSADGLYAVAVDEQGARTGSAARGSVLAFFGTGFGPVSNPPEYGFSAVGDPRSDVMGSVTAMVGGKPAEVLQSGLWPGIPGVYAIVLKVAVDAEAGEGDLWIAVDGVRTPALRFNVE